MFISAEVAADLRHGALRDLKAARNDQAYVSPDTVATVELMDTIGAAWANRQVSDVASEVSMLESPRFAPVDWVSMTVSTASHELKVSEQAVRRLLFRKTLHGEHGPKLMARLHRVRNRTKERHTMPSLIDAEAALAAAHDAKESTHAAVQTQSPGPRISVPR